MLITRDRFKSAIIIWVKILWRRTKKSSLYESRAQHSTVIFGCYILEQRNWRQALVEDYPEGYPRFSALIAADGTFFICRRFLNLRSRLLLHRQDKLSLLEQKLERIDSEETENLFARSCRYDKNVERSAVLSDINSALADYGNRIFVIHPATSLICLTRLQMISWSGIARFSDMKGLMQEIWKACRTGSGVTHAWQETRRHTWRTSMTWWAWARLMTPQWHGWKHG